RTEKQWRTYGDFSQVHTTTISRDGSKVAFTADISDSGSRELLLLDVRSGEITKLAKTGAVSTTWSPDGRNVAIDTMSSKGPKIVIYDVDSGTLRERFDGSYPAWSPTGEWI